MDIIKFVDYDADGCGTKVSTIVVTDKKITTEELNLLQKEVNKIKSEEEDWNFDNVVDEVCSNILVPLNIKYDYISFKEVTL